ncbi:DNA replication origin binding protein [Coprinopsis marcescibilis]|uniref:Origin recognition complex subunit 2 n=1 Tax=Coprinopsis marcescibilis TaxID=230819 RepID=A0A5C3L1Q8_COPMA|nr:DNA replication origin binding protein [Coprinopsis marcescibilis]
MSRVSLRRLENVPAVDSDDLEDEQESLESSDEESVEEEVEEEVEFPQTPSRRKGKRKEIEDESHNLIVQTNFDAYFTYAASRTQTSTNVYSQLVLPMTPEEYATGIKAASKRIKPLQTSILEPQRKRELHTRFLFELQEGFNILCYGIGSKRDFLNDFALSACSKRGHVVIANGYQADFAIKDLLAQIEQIPGLEEFEGSSRAGDKQASRIYEFFAQESQKQHLYLIVHNVDATPLRTSRAKSVLGLLALNPHIHIVASIDHINAPLLWSSSELFSRQPTESSGPTATRGFSWLWHDLTTLLPYDAELAFVDSSSLSGAHGGGRRKVDLSVVQNPAAMSETAANHILASVTQKAKKLFELLARRQLESIAEAADKATNDLQQYGMAYDALFNAARDDFIAVNDTALRSLLGEFRDHNLVLSAPTTSGEVLWIPLRKERLQAVVDSLKGS